MAGAFGAGFADLHRVGFPFGGRVEAGEAGRCERSPQRITRLLPALFHCWPAAQMQPPRRPGDPHTRDGETAVAQPRHGRFGHVVQPNPHPRRGDGERSRGCHPRLSRFPAVEDGCRQCGHDHAGGDVLDGPSGRPQRERVPGDGGREEEHGLEFHDAPRSFFAARACRRSARSCIHSSASARQ